MINSINRKNSIMLLIFWFSILFLTNISFGSSSTTTLNNDFYQNTTAGITVFGLPAIIYGGIDELSNHPVITQISSTTQANKYLCFQVSCNNFHIQDSTENQLQLQQYNNIPGLYCTNASEIANPGTVSLYCGENIKETLDYYLSSNSYYDIDVNSPYIIKKYIEPSGSYANALYYTSKSPEENIEIELYMKTPGTQQPLYMAPSDTYYTIIYMRETYSLGFLSSKSSTTLCQDRTCFKYNLTIPKTGTPQKSLLLIPLIIKNPPQRDSLAKYCRGDTSNNCISKVLLFYPKIYSGNISIEGIKDNNNAYYYGQNITLKMEHYEEYNLGDGGNIIERYIEIYDKDNQIAKISYNPLQNPKGVVYFLNSSLKRKTIKIFYVVKYKNVYNDIILYNSTKEINISNDFVYSLNVDYNITTLRAYHKKQIPEYYLAGSDILMTISPYLQDINGNKKYTQDLSIEIESINSSHSTLQLKTIKEIENVDYIPNNKSKSYLIELPNNITIALQNPTIKVIIHGKINGMVVSKTFYLPLNVNIYPALTKFSSTDFFIGEDGNIQVKFNEPTVINLNDIKIFTSLKHNTTVDVKNNANSDEYFSNITFTIPENKTYNHSLNVLSLDYEINNNKVFFEKFIEITEQIDGLHVIGYIYKNNIKTRINTTQPINISFENDYDVKEFIIYLRNIGTRNIDINNLKVKLNEVEVASKIEVIDDKDKNKNVFSPKEEYAIKIYLIGKNINNRNNLDIIYTQDLLNITLIKVLSSYNNTLNVNLKDNEIIYNPQNQRATITLNLTTNINHLGTIQAKIKAFSNICAQKTVFNKQNIQIINTPGSHLIPITIHDDIIGKCGDKINLTIILYKEKYNQSFLIKVLTIQRKVRKVEQSAASQQLSETRKTIEEIKDLCDELNTNNINKTCENIKISSICDEWINDIEQKLNNINIANASDRDLLDDLNKNASFTLSLLQKCNYSLSFSSKFENIKKEFNQLYEEVCKNKKNVEKINSVISDEDKQKYVHSCLVYENFIDSYLGNINTYKEAINELSYYKKYLSMQEEKKPYGKYLGILLILIIIILIVVYIVIKYFPSKPKIEVDEEDLYQI